MFSNSNQILTNADVAKAATTHSRKKRAAINTNTPIVAVSLTDEKKEVQRMVACVDQQIFSEADISVIHGVTHC
ncbi:hypothetical protein Ddc_11935 [Ditylenchus destructor]|nr:hypothetical protein Ddc_11935 [Ditylenchus destructor]